MTSGGTALSRLAVARKVIVGLTATVMGVAIGLPPFSNSPSVGATSPPLENVIDVEAGGDFACAIVNEDASATSGAVWCWGENQDGQLGTGDTVDQGVATLVSLGEDGFSNTSVEQLALGGSHACAVEAGELYCWGDNWRGQAGAGSDLTTPKKITKPAGVTTWVDVTAGDYHTCAITDGSTVGAIYCWGDGDQLGNGNFSSSPTGAGFTSSPPTYPKATANAQSNPTPSLVVDTDINVWANQPTPFYTDVTNADWNLISAGVDHTCAAKTSGAQAGVYCWGRNGRQQVNARDYSIIWQPAKYTGSYTTTPQAVLDASTVSKLAAGAYNTCIEKDHATPTLTNAVFCFGNMSSIENGDPDYEAALAADGAAITGFEQLGVDRTGQLYQPNTQRFACGLKDGKVYCFGSNAATSVEELLPGEMTANNEIGDLSVGGRASPNTKQLICAVKAGGAYCWGKNSSGQLGNDTTTDSATPVRVLRTPPPPEAPTGLVAAPGDQKITIEFTAGATNGWSVTSYQYSLDGGTTWSYPVRPDLTSPIEILVDHNSQPLTNGQEYTVILRLANGTSFSPPTIIGDASASVTATPTAPTAPGSPTGVTADAGDGRATVSWTAPTSNGGNDIIRYRASVVGNGSLSCTAEPPATSCDVTGLTNGTAYTFEVTATNVNGTSAASTASAAVTPAASSTGTDSGSNTDAGSDTGTDSGTETGTDSGTGSETATDSTTDDAADDTAGDDPIATPETATTSEAVTDDDATELASEPGDGKVIVDGTPVTPTVSRVAAEGTDTPPADRTPEQVEAIQQAAQELVDGFNDIAGEDSPIEVTDTETGAVITGLLTNPDDPDTPVEVPVERVLVMTAGDLAIMAVATDDAGDTLPLDDGSLQMSSNGNVAMAVAGLPTSTAGEIVLLPSRTVLGTFTTTADGMLTGEITIPADLAAGDYGIAIAVGTSRMSLGVKATASPAELPATGGGTDLAAVAMVMLGVGLLLAGRRRRQLS